MKRTSTYQVQVELDDSNHGHIFVTSPAGDIGSTRFVAADIQGTALRIGRIILHDVAEERSAS